ncbi:hypothetical protein [Polyangium sp. y55x31]|uniref:hypothetical protein n=1 Tax=Polyangium sp. y55x31 TaxID=3042688 RepID=UPI0024826778|nr:hypothetical protein [Polyangium sp. y55x31]MDI1475107.1 hypothetical protein [Polyangium sp. y55x31]
MARKIMIASFIATAVGNSTIAQAAAEEIPCTLEARASVTVTVLDAEGAPVSDAVVRYSVRDEPARDCESFTDGEYVCGWETSGHFFITATRGAEAATAALFVWWGGCHVRSERVTLRLSEMPADRSP